MRVLAFASYPVQAAATRYRLHQFTGPLSDRGITLTIRPFIDSSLFKSLYDPNLMYRTALGLLKASIFRFRDILAARNADVLLVQREAMLFGPPIIEWLSSRFSGRPMMLDLDDATYVPYTSPTYGRLGQAVKWFSKTDDLIRWSTLVTCGNRAIAEYVSSKGARARIIPTVVDTDVFRPVPKERNTREVVLGWIGTHSTFPYLQSLFPALQELAQHHNFRVRVVGAGQKQTAVAGLDIEYVDWNMEREVRDFQSFDIGLYPIVPHMYANKWAAGKSGFKAIQYMAVGIPYVATPVGAVNEIGIEGTTHYCATSQAEWREALTALITDAKKREAMGEAGRSFAVQHFALALQADKLAAALREAAGAS